MMRQLGTIVLHHRNCLVLASCISLSLGLKQPAALLQGFVLGVKVPDFLLTLLEESPQCADLLAVGVQGRNLAADRCELVQDGIPARAGRACMLRCWNAHELVGVCSCCKAPWLHCVQGCAQLHAFAACLLLPVLAASLPALQLTAGSSCQPSAAPAVHEVDSMRHWVVVVIVTGLLANCCVSGSSCNCQHLP